MTEKDNYPGKWQGQIPEAIRVVAQGKAELNVNLSICLSYMEHLAYPVYKPLESLKVWDPACGTGEILLLMAAKYPQVSFTACDISPEAQAQAVNYADEMGVRNIQFIDAPLEATQYELILPSRPIGQIDDQAGFLRQLKKTLAEQGLLRIQAEAAKQAENLYRQESVTAMKAGQLNHEETTVLIQGLLALPMEEHVYGVREYNRNMEEAGFKLWSGLHPHSYDPDRYLPDMENKYFFEGLSLIDKAYLAEQFCGQMQIYNLLYVHPAYHPEMPSLYDAQAPKYIPHLSPYVTIGQQEERIIVGLKHQHLLLEAGIEFEDLSIPEELLRVLQAVDGKSNFEQIHRRFLPMPWERFWILMNACWEEEIIYLHRA